MKKIKNGSNILEIVDLFSEYENTVYYFDNLMTMFTFSYSTVSFYYNCCYRFGECAFDDIKNGIK